MTLGTTETSISQRSGARFGHPVVSDRCDDVWVFGTAAESHAVALSGLVAPDFTLPDLAGVPHTLSALRGKKIFLTTWASWWGCRHDSPVWQHLFDSLRTENFAVVAVAEGSGGANAARPGIEQANPAYPCLIDVDRRVAALYGMVNVPQCVWIDEAGHIVQPAETAGSTDHFRRMDPIKRTLSPEDQAARAAARTAYLDAVRDWIGTGHHALDADHARRKPPRITHDMALADANFRLGIWLRRNGRPDEATVFLA
jgi:peroxiredoxin